MLQSLGDSIETDKLTRPPVAIRVLSKEPVAVFTFKYRPRGKQLLFWLQDGLVTENVDFLQAQGIIPIDHVSRDVPARPSERAFPDRPHGGDSEIKEEDSELDEAQLQAIELLKVQY